MMNVDRRRRFAFGVTIENTDMRIWFCCRQIVFVTHRFDFMMVNFGLCLHLLCTFTDQSRISAGFLGTNQVDPTNFVISLCQRRETGL